MPPVLVIVVVSKMVSGAYRNILHEQLTPSAASSEGTAELWSFALSLVLGGMSCSLLLAEPPESLGTDFR